MAQLRAVSTGEGAIRCPYCHDQLQAAREELVECPGCHTVHHGACIAEIGRCTVLGCRQPITREALPLPPPLESPVRREVRQRAAGKAHQFLRGREEARASGRQEPELDHSAQARQALRRGILLLFLPGVGLALVLILGGAIISGAVESPELVVAGFVVAAALPVGYLLLRRSPP